MKNITILVSCLFSTHLLFAQWTQTPTGGHIYNTNTGNVGIGTSNPANKLQIGEFATSSSNSLVIPGTYNFEQARLAQYGNGNTGLEFINHTSLTESYGIRLLANTDQAKGLQWQYAPSTTAYSNLSYSTGLFMALNGNVGIGTIAPLQKLHVNGNMAIGNGSSGQVSALNIQGPNTAGINSYQDINYSFATAGSSRIRAYRGTGWSTYLQFLINNSTATSDNPQVAMHINDNGNIGIGTTTPSDKLQLGDFGAGHSNCVVIPGTYNFEQVKLGQYNGNGGAGLEFVNHIGAANSYGVRLVANSDQVQGLQIQYAPSSQTYSGLSYATALFVGLNGNVLIGKTSQANAAYKLDVNGNIRANKVVINTTGADFVFDSSYQLASLKDVENYIQQNHHLPYIPSAAEMQQNGLDVAENQTRLLQKIEELTLYTISQNKELTALQNLAGEQNKKIASLESLLQEQGELIKQLANKLKTGNK